MANPQILVALRRPVYTSAALAIGVVFGASFLYFNQFLFLSPYLVFYVPPGGEGLLTLDLAISALAGITIAASFFAVRTVSRAGGRQGRVGLLGIVTAFVAGACPCYYLVPLLAVAGGAGGALAAVGLYLEAYQVPIKLLSLALLLGVSYSLERSLRVACEVQMVSNSG